MKDLQKERLLELLADQTIFGLNDEEVTELEQLKNNFTNLEEDASLELTAAAITLASLETVEEMPTGLRTKLFADAADFFSRAEQMRTEADNASPAEALSEVPTQERYSDYVKPASSPNPFWQWLGWAFAAAACVALAVNLWLTRAQKPVEVAKNPEVLQTPSPELTPAQKRAQLLASATDAVQLSLTSPTNEKEVLGDVVWSNSQQKGFVRVRGLPANNVSEEAYQLWIVDEAQNPKTPLSGGVFNVTSGEVVVPIEAQLKVKNPKAIAISKERAGGVVVSAPERLVALAKI